MSRELVQDYVVAKAAPIQSDGTVVLPDPVFMRLSAATKTWYGMLSGNYTQRMQAWERDSLCKQVELLIAEAIAKELER